MKTPKSFRDIAQEHMSEDEDIKNTEVETKEISEDEEVQPEKDTAKTPEETTAFTEKTDLKGKTPEELDRIYDEWQKKYTQTRQRETAELKEVRQKMQEMEAKLKQVESAGDKIQTPELQEEKDAVQRQFDLGNLTVKEYTNKMRELLREDAREIAREEYQSIKKQDQEESYQKTALDHFIGADSRLDEDNPTYDRRMRNALSADMADALDAHIATHGTSVGFDYKAETTRLIQEYDQEVENIVKSRIQKTTTQAQDRAYKTAKTSSPGQNLKTVPEKRELRDLIRSKMS